MVPHLHPSTLIYFADSAVVAVVPPVSLELLSLAFVLPAVGSTVEAVSLVTLSLCEVVSLVTLSLLEVVSPFVAIVYLVHKFHYLSVVVLYVHLELVEFSKKYRYPFHEAVVSVFWTYFGGTSDCVYVYLMIV